jgi:predicted transcriptional regulator
MAVVAEWLRQVENKPDSAAPLAQAMNRILASLRMAQRTAGQFAADPKLWHTPETALEVRLQGALREMLREINRPALDVDTAWPFPKGTRV